MLKVSEEIMWAVASLNSLYLLLFEMSTYPPPTPHPRRGDDLDGESKIV